MPNIFMLGQLIGGKSTKLNLTDEVSILWTEPKDLDRAFVNYFQTLFSTASPSDIESNLRGMLPRVTTKMNSQLLNEFI